MTRQSTLLIRSSFRIFLGQVRIWVSRRAASIIAASGERENAASIISSIGWSMLGRIISIGALGRSPFSFASRRRSEIAAESKTSRGRTHRSRFLIRSSSGSALVGRSSDFLLRASGRAALDPGLYTMRKLNWDRNSDHRTCLWLSALVVVKYSRFL